MEMKIYTEPLIINANDIIVTHSNDKKFKPGLNNNYYYLDLSSFSSFIESTKILEQLILKSPSLNFYFVFFASYNPVLKFEDLLYVLYPLFNYANCYISKRLKELFNDSQTTKDIYIEIENSSIGKIKAKVVYYEQIKGHHLVALENVEEDCYLACELTDVFNENGEWIGEVIDIEDDLYKEFLERFEDYIDEQE